MIENSENETVVKPDERWAIASELLFIELKDEVRQRLGLPTRVPILKSDLESEFKNGTIPPSAWAAGIEALKLLHPNLREYDTFLARYNLLEGRRALDDHDEYAARRFYQKALDLNNGALSAEAAFYLAALSRSDHDQAIDYYQRSVELNPNVATPHFELAKLLRERRDLQGALTAFNRAAQLEPTTVNIFNEIAETYVMANETTAASDAFRAAIAIEPNNWILLVKLGLAEYKLEDYAAAIKNLRRGLDNAPDDLEEDGSQSFYAEGLYNLGLAYQQSGDALRARKLFKTVLSFAPEHSGAVQALSV